MKHWFHQLFIAVYQLLNVLVAPLHRGAWADETLSSRACRIQRWALTELSEMVDLFERKHTQAPEMTRRRGWLRGIWQLVRPA